jgi:GNAT superfamily N-acetyltransferase
MDDFDEIELIRNANQVENIVQVCNLDSFISLPKLDCPLQVMSCKSETLVEEKKIELFSIFESNMKLLYESNSWGWNKAERMKEIFHPLSRFLIISDHENKIAAFTVFRFDWDDEEEPEHAVLYCYELQIERRMQAKGLGQKLMEMLITVSQCFHMWKVMLTCFKENTNAMKFYSKIGFGIDFTSPSFYDCLSEPYEILSNFPTKKK